jgi:hypothetical protein
MLAGVSFLLEGSMRTRGVTSILSLVFLSGCGAGSVGFTGMTDSHGIPLEPQITVGRGGTGSAVVQLLAKGAEAQPYNITVSSGDPNVTGSAMPNPADPMDGVPLDITITIDVAPMAMAGGFADVTVSAADQAGHLAGTGVQVTIGP